MAQYKAGWYPDPRSAKGSGVLRWYDGTAWTSNVSRPQGGSAPVQRPAAAAARPRPAAQAPTAEHGATWESIPQPGTTYTSDALNRPALPVRIGKVLLTLAALVLLGALLFALLG